MEGTRLWTSVPGTIDPDMGQGGKRITQDPQTSSQVKENNANKVKNLRQGKLLAARLLLPCYQALQLSLWFLSQGARRELHPCVLNRASLTPKRGKMPGRLYSYYTLYS